MTGFVPIDLVLGAFTSSPDGLWITDADGLTLHANPRMAEIVGIDLDDLVGSRGDGFVSDEQGVRDFAVHVERMRSGHPGSENEDCLLRRADGALVWTLVSWSPIPGPDGTPLGFLHRVTEHAERHELVEALRERERQLKTAQEIAHVGSWSWEVASDVLEWSEELFRVYGLEPDGRSATYDDFLNGLHPEDRDGVAGVILTAMRQQDDFGWEARVLLADDGVRWVRGRGMVERDADGVVTRLSGTAQDVTDLHNADEIATEATRRLHLLQRIAEAANRSTTVADALVRAAHALRDHSSWHPLCVWARTAPGEPLVALQLPETTLLDLPEPDLARAEEGWRSRDIDVVALPDRPGYSLITLPVPLGRAVACVIQLVADVEAPDVYTWSLLRQIGDQLGRVAERERSAVQLSEARDDAMSASQHKSDFLAVMSHEIRTPMNGVIGLNDLLLRTGLDEQQRRLAEELRGAGLTLLGLINDILDLSKIESGRLELENTTFDVRTVMDEAASILAGPAQEKGLELVMACDPDVPRIVVGDPVRLRQVLTNLGSNAVKFTDCGEVVIEATVETDDPDDPDLASTVTLRVTVRDTGIGIDLARVDDIFDVFTQADLSTTRRHGGTGLGLAICRQLVDAMGGDLEVASTEGVGSVFSFTAHLGRVRDDRSRRRTVGDYVAGSRVLVVDDNAAAGQHLSRLLEQWSLIPRVVTTVAEAMRMAAAGDLTDYRLALIDLDLPDGDGLQLGHRLLEWAPGLELLLVTSDPMMAVDEIEGAGFGSWVTKPVRTSALYGALAGRDDPTREPDPVDMELDMRVLVVEDNRVNQLVATGVLERLGCRVDTAPTGVEAVQAIVPGHPYDLVLMDCRMPRMDGFAATRAIRLQEDGTRVPIVAMTASALDGERDRCLAAGMDDFLTKPVDRAQLARTLHRWAGGPIPVGVPHEVPMSEPEPVVLDLERVAMLSELVKDGIDFFERARMSFLARIDGALAELRITVTDDDAKRTEEAAHALKGSALNIGLIIVGEVAFAIERHAGTGTVDGLAPLLDELDGAVSAGVEALVNAAR